MSKDISVLRSNIPLKTITELLEEKKYKYEYKILDLSIQESNRIVSEKLNIPLATKVLSYKKLRCVNSIPCSIEQVYIEYNKVEGLEKENLSNISLYKKMKELYGYEVNHTSEEIKVVKANCNEAELLDLKEDSYILLTTGTSYLADNSVLEYYQLVSRYNFFKYRSVSIYE